MTAEEAYLAVEVADHEEDGPRHVEDYEGTWFVRGWNAALDESRAAVRGTEECGDPEHPGGAFCTDTTGLATCYPPSVCDALLLAVEEVDNAWNDESDHIEYHDGLPERLIALRRAYERLGVTTLSDEAECECGEPVSAGIHDPIRTWVNNPNNLHAARPKSVTLPDADEAWEALKQAALDEAEKFVQDTAPVFRHGGSFDTSFISRHRPLIEAAVLRGVRERVEGLRTVPSNNGGAIWNDALDAVLAAIDGTRK